VGLTTISSYTS